MRRLLPVILYTACIQRTDPASNAASLRGLISYPLSWHDDEPTQSDKQTARPYCLPTIHIVVCCSAEMGPQAAPRVVQCPVLSPLRFGQSGAVDQALRPLRAKYESFDPPRSVLGKNGEKLPEGPVRATGIQSRRDAVAGSGGSRELSPPFGPPQLRSHFPFVAGSSRAEPKHREEGQNQDGSEADQQGVAGPGPRPARQLQRRPRGRRPVPLAGDHHGPRGQPVRRRRVLPEHLLPGRLPVQAAQGELHDAHLPLQHQRQRRHLPGHPEGPVEPRADHLEGAAVDLLAAHGRQPGRPAGVGDLRPSPVRAAAAGAAPVLVRRGDAVAGRAPDDSKNEDSFDVLKPPQTHTGRPRAPPSCGRWHSARLALFWAFVGVHHTTDVLRFLSQIRQAIMDTLCSWCGVTRWQYKCSACDPRKEKRLCSSCSILWHARGFARSHQLTSSYGETRSYLAWWSARELDARNGSNSAGAAAKPAAEAVAANGRSTPASDKVDAKPAAPEEEKAAEGAGSVVGTEVDAGAPAEEKLDGGENENESAEGELEFETVGESVESGEDVDNASVEQGGELEEKTKAPAAEAAVAGDSAAATTDQEEPKKGESVSTNGNQEQNGDSASPDAATATPASVSAPTSDATLNSTTAAASAPAASSSAPAAPSSTQAVASREPTTQPKLVGLDKLLRWFPTTDQVLVEMLAARIESALVIEDALICARIGKCEEETCRSVLLHYEHCKRDEMCGDSKCSEISIVYRHRRACLKKDTAPVIDGKKFVCPFCIRIRQRRSLGVVAALDHLISDQRRALRNAHSEANRNFCLQSINTWTQRKKLLRAETDRLNQLASESNAPIFNFPLYRWHFSDAVLIKREPASAESSEDTQAGPPTAELLADDTNNVMMIAARDKGKNAQDDNMDTQQSQDTPSEGIPGNANFNADFINQLLQAKGESGDGREVAQREFDGVIELGYAIVDASFCAPSKAQRCLLNCKSILVHLQHHLDIEVCTQPMCTAVEHHFAHLSQCKARDNSDSCEYCLRVEERRLIRSVDFMEAEQPEAEAKMQKIINDITASFTNHHPDEREQEMIQLEDELEQIEENKRDLAEKLDAARQDLRFVRKNLEHRGMPISDSRLQLHFIKVRRNEGSNSSSKKRRLLGSLD
ncbi:hypothetical protein ON010_g12846 [Phytophthora cinnamomi]|nr:hypothetical protein ON010_g12846 [Phytophthora cinnamomi]